MRKQLLALLGVAVILAAACGGSEPNPQTFANQNNNSTAETCETVPVSVTGISVLGQVRVGPIKDIKVCVIADVAPEIVPTVTTQPACGTPCFTIEIQDFNVHVDAKVRVTYKNNEGEQEVVSYDPDAIDQRLNDSGRLCVIGVGDPDPCAHRITDPTDLTAAAGKRQISLEWTASTDTGGAGLAGYELWRSTTGEEASYAYHTTVPADQTTFVDSGLTKGQTYYYFVVAFDGDGNRSHSSNVASAAAQ